MAVLVLNFFWRLLALKPNKCDSVFHKVQQFWWLVSEGQGNLAFFGAGMFGGSIIACFSYLKFGIFKATTMIAVVKRF